MFQVIGLDEWRQSWRSYTGENMLTVHEAGRVCGEHCVKETAEKHAAKNRKMFKGQRYEVREMQEASR